MRWRDALRGQVHWPGVTEPALERVAANAAREAERLYGSGKPVAYLGCLLFPDDELVLCMFESPSFTLASRAAERAGMPCERLMNSIWLGVPDGEAGPSR